MEWVYVGTLTALIVGVIATIFGMLALIEVRAMKNSTHQVQILNPATQEFTTLTDTQKQNLQKDFFDNI